MIDVGVSDFRANTHYLQERLAAVRKELLGLGVVAFLVALVFFFRQKITHIHHASAIGLYLRDRWGCFLHRGRLNVRTQQPTTRHGASIGRTELLELQPRATRPSPPTTRETQKRKPETVIIWRRCGHFSLLRGEDSVIQKVIITRFVSPI